MNPRGAIGRHNIAHSKTLLLPPLPKNNNTYVQIAETTIAINNLNPSLFLYAVPIRQISTQKKRKQLHY